jgi:hypothetical protein
MLNLVSGIDTSSFLLDDYLTFSLDTDSRLHTDAPVFGTYNRLIMADTAFTFKYHDKEYEVLPGEYVLFRCDILHGARISKETRFKVFKPARK